MLPAVFAWQNVMLFSNETDLSARVFSILVSASFIHVSRNEQFASYPVSFSLKNRFNQVHQAQCSRPAASSK